MNFIYVCHLDWKLSSVLFFIAVHFPVINFTLTISLKAPRLSVTPSFPLIQICSLTSNSIFLLLRLIYLVTHLVAWGTFFWPETLEKSRNTHYNLLSLLQITYNLIAVIGLIHCSNNSLVTVPTSLTTDVCFWISLRSPWMQKSRVNHWW